METQVNAEVTQDLKPQELPAVGTVTQEKKTEEQSSTAMDIDAPSETAAPAPEAPRVDSNNTTTPEIAKTETSTNNANPTANPTNPANRKRERVEPPEGMSRNAYKKLLRQQQWDAEKEQRAALRKERTAKEKERKRLRREQEEKEKAERAAAAKAAGKEGEAAATVEGEGETAPTEQQGDSATSTVTKRSRRERKKPQDITFLLDCSFDDKMLQKEINSLASQIIRIYSENRKSTAPVKLKLTSYGGRLEDKFDNQLNGQRKGWKGFTFTSEPYEVNDQTVYLTTEGTEALTTLEPGTTYIIGGIVDRNRYKGLCYEKAAAQGLRTARLPIDDYIKMSSRKVLTCNHVVEIMLKYLECKDWKTAFHQVIPERKLNEGVKLTKKQRRAAALERKRRAEAGEDVGEVPEGEEYDSQDDSDHEDETAESKEEKSESKNTVSETVGSGEAKASETTQSESSTKRKSDEVVSQEDEPTVAKRRKSDAEMTEDAVTSEGAEVVIP